MTNRRVQNQQLLELLKKPPDWKEQGSLMHVSESALNAGVTQPLPKSAPDTVTFLKDLVNPFELKFDRVSDGGYQRDPIASHWKKIAENFRPELCEELAVSRRKDGSLWVISGQHRVLGARAANILALDAKIFVNLTRSQEAELFTAYDQERRKVSAVTMYQASVVAGAPIAVKLDKFLKSRNIQVMDRPSAITHIKCVGMLLKYIDEDPAALTITFDLALPMYNRGNTTPITGLTIGGLYTLYRTLKMMNQEDPSVAMLTDRTYAGWFKRQTGQTLRDKVFADVRNKGGGGRAYECAEAIRASINYKRDRTERMPPISKLAKEKEKDSQA